MQSQAQIVRCGPATQAICNNAVRPNLTRGAIQSDVVQYKNQIPPNPPFSKGGTNTALCPNGLTVLIPPFEKKGGGRGDLDVAPKQSHITLKRTPKAPLAVFFNDTSTQRGAFFIGFLPI